MDDRQRDVALFRYSLIREAADPALHANAATTLGVYAHFVEAADEDAATHLGAVLDTARSVAK